MAYGFQPIVLCVSLESDLDGFIGGSGFLLPVAGKPLLYYSLQLLEQSGFSTDIIVVVPEEKKEEVESLPERYSLGIVLNVIGIDTEDDCSTTNILRILRRKNLLRAEDLLILPGDLVCDINLHQFANQHILKYATVTALYSSVLDEVNKVIVPGPKSKHIPETEEIGIDSITQRIVVLDDDKVKRKVFVQHPNIQLRKLVNAHVYFLKARIADYLLKDSSIESIQGDLIPLLVKSQFRKPYVNEENEGDVDADIRSYAPFDEDYIELMKLSSCYNPDFSSGALSCYAFLTNDFCIRANSVQNYVTANKQMMKRSIPDGISAATRESSIIASTVPEKSTITNSCIGEHCTVSERVRIVNSIVTHHVTVEAGSSLTDCIVLDNAIIGKNSHLKECIVGTRFSVPFGTKSSNETFENEDI